MLERLQVWIYLAAILMGLVLAGLWPGFGEGLTAWVWAVLGLLLFVTFAQIPWEAIRLAFNDRRFLAAALVGNFVLVPLVLLALLPLAPDDPAIRLGILLVLLMPCTDWFITFSRQGGGDGARAAAFTPVSLAAQFLMLPVYLTIILGPGEALGLMSATVFAAAALLIGLPLLAAVLLEQALRMRGRVEVWQNRFAIATVPLLALVVGLIALVEAPLVFAGGRDLLGVIPVYALYLLGAAALAWGLARAFALPGEQGRTLAFSLGTRNSFVVLPVALALPEVLHAAVMVIVLQSLVELFGMLVYLRWMPRLFPPAQGCSAQSGSS
ncbi:bile acid:sodium symporter [Thioalkalivibrio thiocyanoxidans]|uniref:bile acid:sodium symporter n=1 Tax=Thioalkalivibrio thiocyanoxidans TaxID=152475 RepID=UPI000477E2FA|nr:bile acid:sodium symporter [Thioalkalivibrio thiocyanoxidans]